MPAVLSLKLPERASFGTFVPGVAHDYTASAAGTVTSTAGSSTLSFSEPGHLTNGAYALREPLRVELSKSTWAAPVSNDPLAVTFRQHIGATDACAPAPMPPRSRSHSTTEP